MENYTLITGASSGIGEAYAREFAKQGCNLIIVARSKHKLDSLAKELQEKNSIQVKTIDMDLSTENSAQKLYEKITENNIRVETLINNAGFATKGLFDEISFEMQHQELLLNVATLTELTYFIIKDMKKYKKGLVINVASSVAFNPFPYSAVYAATKAYVLSFSEALSYEYKRFNLKVLAVCPGPTDTHFFDSFDNSTNRLRKPEDVVNTTMKALKKNKNICTDGFASKVQMLLHRIVPRRLVIKITGKSGETAWGENKLEKQHR